jgi:glycosyltransferase involved in cell wall biosynthesis
MSRILVVLPYIPWPARRSGIAVRYAPLLEHLARHHTVDLLVIENAVEPADFGELASQLRHAERIPVPQTRSTWRRLAARVGFFLPWTPAHSITTYGSREVVEAVARRVAANAHDCVLWAGRELLDCAIAFRRRFPAVRFVMDMVDSPYLYDSRQLNADAGNTFGHYDLWKVGRMERWARRHMDAVIYISQVDAAAAPGASSERVSVLANGVLTATLAPAAASRSAGKRIGFLGNMAYPPNVRATLALHRDVFLPLRTLHPELELLVIGRDPVPEIVALQGPGVTVTGTVPDVWPAVQSVDVFAFPMDTGSGLQNKILEAMFAAKPVVTTPACLAPLGAEVPRDLLCAATADEFRAHLGGLLADPAAAAALGARGREFARRNFDWEKHLPRFEAAILGR